VPDANYCYGNKIERKVYESIMGEKIMGKEQRSVKNDKKQPLLTPKEKKAAKKLKKDSK